MIVQKSQKTEVYKITQNSANYYVKYYECESNEPKDLAKAAASGKQRLAVSIPVPPEIESQLPYSNKPFVVLPDYGEDMFNVVCNVYPNMHTLNNYEGLLIDMFVAIEEFNEVIGRPHGDVKLENFLYNGTQVVISDYEECAFTTNYMSLKQHSFGKTSILDDFESFGYTLAFMYQYENRQFWGGKDFPHYKVYSLKTQYMSETQPKQIANTLIRKFIGLIPQYQQSRSEMIDILKQIALCKR